MNNADDNGIQPVTKSDILELTSWDRTRSTDELLGFIARREFALSEKQEG